MQTVNVAIVGATGNVGQALLSLWSEQLTDFPAQFFLLASEQSVGKTQRLAGKSHQVNDVTNFDWQQVQIALFCASQQAAKQYAQQAAEAGCIVIDNSGYFAADWAVPLWVPSVNDQVLADYRSTNIIALANSVVCQTALAVQPLLTDQQLTRLQVTHLLSASVRGSAGVEELAGQTAQLLNGLPIEPQQFARQLAFNQLAAVPDEQGSVADERIFADQLRRIFADEHLPIASQFVQSPVFYGNTQLVQLEFSLATSVAALQQAWQAAADCQLVVAPDFPSPLPAKADPYYLQLGNLQQSFATPDLWQFCSVADNIHFCGALQLFRAYQKLLTCLAAEY